MTWTAPTPAEVDGPLVGPDRPMLEGYLAWQRKTLLNICAGLTGEQLATRPIPTSKLSLLGLVRHLAKVERTWFRIRAAGQEVPPLYAPGTDDDFELVDPDDAPAAFDRFREECRLADEAVAGLGFDHEFHRGEETFSVRFAYVHLINEYARHNGHADLIREAIDGVTAR